MARLKTFKVTRKPDASGSVKAPRKSGPGIAPKGILKKTAAPTAAHAKQKKRAKTANAAPAAPSSKKKKQARVVEEPPTEDEDEEDTVAVPDTIDDEAEVDDEDAATATTGDDDEDTDGAPARPRKINHSLRRLGRMKTLQKSVARLCTEAGFKRIVRHILHNSPTAAIKLRSVRFTRDALLNLQASVESLLQLILADTRQQVYTIMNRKARVTAAPIAITAEQRLRSMAGAQFINDYRDMCNL